MALSGRYDFVGSILKAVFPPKKAPNPALQQAQFMIAARKHNASLKDRNHP